MAEIHVIETDFKGDVAVAAAKLLQLPAIVVKTEHPYAFGRQAPVGLNAEYSAAAMAVGCGDDPVGFDQALPAVGRRLALQSGVRRIVVDVEHPSGDDVAKLQKSQADPGDGVVIALCGNRFKGPTRKRAKRLRARGSEKPLDSTPKGRKPSRRCLCVGFEIDDGSAKA
ncbi:hypothetical protein [Bosea sp. (in: a-proteobacteria)]|uniref:hypothetical protein n=1 Tax=Bosea sp. (in: a-proteobacteria) TaxID=1871050 RepID=UPI0025C7209E|nr:hypothetical protein [Bosea sp. (in: a-proteobacteria)]